MSVKSNLLYDLTSTLNVGLELPISGKFSVDVPVNFNPWTFGGGRKWKHWLVQPALRYWPSRLLGGSFWGIHGHVGEYNVARVFGQARYQGWLLGGGLSYGYRWNFGYRWGMETEIGVGYARLNHKKYSIGEECPKCGSLLKQEGKNYVGVTKVALAVVYTFGRKPKMSVRQDFADTHPSPLPPITGWEVSRELPVADSLLVAPPVRYRQERGQACVWFPVNQFVLHREMEQNRRELQKIERSMQKIQSHPGAEIRQVKISAYASPEGDEAHNRALSIHRAETLRNYMCEVYALPDSLVSIEARGENWEGLAEVLRTTDHLADEEREELLSILEADDPDTRKARLKAYRGGRTYQWLLRDVYPKLRVSAYCIDYTLPTDE
jgi:outer membrane protein OmpA-like peptidoglycan-associated protein